MVGFEPTFATYLYRYGRYKRPLVHQHLVAGEGFEPPTSRLWALRATTALSHDILFVITSATSWKPPLTRCLKESDCGLILLSYGNIVVTEGLEPPTGGDPIRLMRPTLHLYHNLVAGTGFEPASPPWPQNRWARKSINCFSVNYCSKFKKNCFWVPNRGRIF